VYAPRGSGGPDARHNPHNNARSSPPGLVHPDARVAPAWGGGHRVPPGSAPVVRGGRAGEHSCAPANGGNSAEVGACRGFSSMIGIHDQCATRLRSGRRPGFRAALPLGSGRFTPDSSTYCRDETAAHWGPGHPVTRKDARRTLSPRPPPGISASLPFISWRLGSGVGAILTRRLVIPAIRGVPGPRDPAGGQLPLGAALLGRTRPPTWKGTFALEESPLTHVSDGPTAGSGVAM
jgi:hypothetical protein